MRYVKTTAQVLVIVLAAGGAVACSGGGTPGSGAGTSAAVNGGGSSNSSNSSGSSHGSAKVTKAGRQVDVPTQPAVTKGEKWLTGPAGQLLSTVNTDVGKISADQRAGKHSAAKSLGPLLAADARAALAGPMPPVRASVYRVALEDFEQIGQDVVSGNFSKTTSLLTTANVDILSVTTAANTVAPVNSAAQVGDPNDG
jgi:hypothetical protein